MRRKYKKVIIDGKEIDPRIWIYAPAEIHQIVASLKEDGVNISDYIVNAFERHYVYPRFIEKLCYTNVDEWTDEDIIYWVNTSKKVELINKNPKILERYIKIFRKLQDEIEESGRWTMSQKMIQKKEGGDGP